jgi:hypothetical protein
VDAFNEALVDMAWEPESPAPREGVFRVAQVVVDPPPDLLEAIGAARGADGTGAPDPPGVVRTVLSVDHGRVTIRHQWADAGGPGGDGPEADVSVVLSYDDAVSLSLGTLDAVDALGAGRVQVRGDLSVLVAGQALLAAAAVRLEALHAATTY